MRILGIDPGLVCVGFGLLSDLNDRLELIDYGVVRTDSKDSLSRRIQTIYSDMTEIIQSYKPDVVSIEDLFYGKSVKSALLLGHARGAILLSAAENNLPLFSYSPRKIKSAVTGNGNADKSQVQFMVQRSLSLEDTPEPADASDALAAAICYFQDKRFE